MDKINKQKIANELFESYEDENKVFVTEDGQGFFDEGAAKNHAIAKDFDAPKVFFREGFSDEMDTDTEEALMASEENVEILTAVLEKVTDVANVEAETAIEVTEADHQAVQIVASLRREYETVTENANKAFEEITAFRQFQAAVAKLVAENKPKLAEAITQLLPAETN